MRRKLWASGVGLIHAVSGVAAADYIWPSKYDYLEDVMMLQSGYIRHGFMDEVNPCSFGTNIKGRQNAAEWIRTAYHDMSTHDVATGQGGLDASVMFELDREENKGDAFNNTFGFMGNFYNTRASVSDLLALSVITASDLCGGPKMAFRAGRVDATEAGPKGVPEPDQDLETHTNIFAKAGFNTSDMIAMVACGHTLGGVHNSDFPEITDDTAEDGVHMFEAGNSNANFDNAIVTEYLDGSTVNLLVIGSNETTNSDGRIFRADGNATMKAMADPAAFQSRCADILERMIDTVPSSVALTDAIQPIEVKPYVEELALDGNGTLRFEGRIRLRITGNYDDDRTVHLTYADREGKNASRTIEARRATLKGGTSSGLFRELFAWHEFATTLDAGAGISKFHVHLTSPSTGAVEVRDNGGAGFPLDDAVLYQKAQSCVTGPGGDDGSTMDLTVTAAVRKDRAGEPVHLDLAHVVARQGIMLPAFAVRRTNFQKTEVEKAGYVIFEARTPFALTIIRHTFDIVLGEGEAQSSVEFQNTGPLTETCESL